VESKRGESKGRVVKRVKRESNERVRESKERVKEKGQEGGNTGKGE
jgi:hypothetical protein